MQLFILTSDLMLVFSSCCVMSLRIKNSVVAAASCILRWIIIYYITGEVQVSVQPNKDEDGAVCADL